MTTALFNDGFPSAHRTTRQRIESSIDLRRLFFAIDSDPVLIGAGATTVPAARTSRMPAWASSPPTCSTPCTVCPLRA